MAVTDQSPEFTEVGYRDPLRYRVIAERTIVYKKEAVSARGTPAEAVEMLGLILEGYSIKRVFGGASEWEVVGACEGCGTLRLEDSEGVGDQGWETSSEDLADVCPTCYAAALEDARREKVSAWVGDPAPDGDCENPKCSGTGRTKSRRHVLLTSLKIVGGPTKDTGNVELQSQVGRFLACDFCIDDGDLA